MLTFIPSGIGHVTSQPHMQAVCGFIAAFVYQANPSLTLQKSERVKLMLLVFIVQSTALKLHIHTEAKVLLLLI